MRVIRHLAQAGSATRPRVVCSGRFDGVHRGHQRVLARVVERALSLGGESIAIVARDDRDVLRLCDLRQQLEWLRRSNVDCVVFAGASELEPAAQRLGARVLVAARGCGGSAPAGATLDTVPPYAIRGVPLSSVHVRAALSRGELIAVAAMLGRDAAVGGRVVHGFHRGGPLGIPTANLRVKGIQLPPDGVYAVRAHVGGASLNGVANIGFNPTFGNRVRSVETHLLDFDGDLYGQRLEIAFVARLRGEQKFPDVQALLAQIRSDIAAARRFFQ
jgi:riboflavin kinase/FMN adenylyltransferase